MGTNIPEKTRKKNPSTTSRRSRVPLNQACRRRDVRHGKALIEQLGHARVPWIRARGTMCGFHRRGGGRIAGHVVHGGEFVDRRCSGLALLLATSNRETEIPSDFRGTDARLSRYRWACICGSRQVVSNTYRGWMTLVMLAKASLSFRKLVGSPYGINQSVTVSGTLSCSLNESHNLTSSPRRPCSSPRRTPLPDPSFQRFQTVEAAHSSFS